MVLMASAAWPRWSGPGRVWLTVPHCHRLVSFSERLAGGPGQPLTSIAALLPAKLASALNWGFAGTVVATTRLLKDPLTQVAALFVAQLAADVSQCVMTRSWLRRARDFPQTRLLGWPVL